MALGIPYFTLDATGSPVALYEDGTVQPLPLTGGTVNASNRAPGRTGTRTVAPIIQPGPGTTRLSGRDAPARRGGDTRRAAEPRIERETIPPPGGGGGYGGIDVRGRLASARARLGGAIGGGGGGYSDDGGIPRPERPERLRGRYAGGLDPTQAGGLALAPSSMIPRVFPKLTPADPLYGRLASLPAGQIAQLMGGQGTPEDIANNLGRLYERAGTRGWLPSTNRLLRNLSRGKGIETMFEGVKAGKGDMESFAQPGYAYGSEPLPMGEAAYTYGNLLDAALFQEPALTAAKYGVEAGGWGSYLVDKWASKALTKKPGAGKPIYKSVSSKLFR